jgi:hypothetical protein
VKVDNNNKPSCTVPLTPGTTQCMKNGPTQGYYLFSIKSAAVPKNNATTVYIRNSVFDAFGYKSISPSYAGCSTGLQLNAYEWPYKWASYFIECDPSLANYTPHGRQYGTCNVQACAAGLSCEIVQADYYGSNQVSVKVCLKPGVDLKKRIIRNVEFVYGYGKSRYVPI